MDLREQQMASSSTEGINRNEDTSSDSDDSGDNENLAEVEARITTLQIQVQWLMCDSNDTVTS